MKDNRLDDYLNDDSYLGHPVGEDGFSKFFKEDTTEYYFAYIENEQLIFKSEGYTTESGRDNGIKSVKKNAPIEKRYRLVKLGDGEWCLSLRAGNHKEVAVTRTMDSEAAAWSLLPSQRDKGMPLATVPSEKGKEEDYLKTKEYEGHERNPYYPDFSTFDKDDLHYFAMLDDKGSVLLRSEGYSTIAARDKGIRSVIKNKDVEKRRKIIERFGHYFLIIKAGNHQEIARSCALEDEASALALFTPSVALGTIPVEASSEPEVIPESLEEDSTGSVIEEIVEDELVETEESKSEELESEVPEEEDSDAIGAVPVVGALAGVGGALIPSDPVFEKPELDPEFSEEAIHPEENDEDSGSVENVPIVGALIGALVETIEEGGKEENLATSNNTLPPPKKEPNYVPPSYTEGGGRGCVNWKILLPLILLVLALLWFLKSCEGCKNFGTTPTISAETETDRDNDVPTEMDIHVDVEPDTENIADASTSADDVSNPFSDSDSDASTEDALAHEESDANDNNSATKAEDKTAAAATELETKRKAAEKAAADAAAELQAEKAAISVNTARAGLESIYYDYDKWDLRDDAKAELDKLINILEGDDNLRAEFLGHTDSRGTNKYNERLSRKRAQAALDYVVGKGISKRRLVWRKYSEDNPKAQNDTKSEEKLQINRRVDLRIRRFGKILYDTQKSVREMR